jgi:hypothetical protein
MRAFRKTDVVVGKSIYLRAATKADAAFVFELRSHSFKSTYLHKIHGTVKDQEAWLEKSYADPHQFYFTINSAAHERLGLVRIYDQQGDSFCWGSWLIKDGAPASTAIESALLVYRFALSQGFKQSHFDVRIGNDSVIAFHQRFGASEVCRTDSDIYFRIERDAICSSMQRFKKFLPVETAATASVSESGPTVSDADPV